MQIRWTFACCRFQSVDQFGFNETCCSLDFRLRDGQILRSEIDMVEPSRKFNERLVAALPHL